MVKILFITLVLEVVLSLQKRRLLGLIIPLAEFVMIFVSLFVPIYSWQIWLILTMTQLFIYILCRIIYAICSNNIMLVFKIVSLVVVSIPIFLISVYFVVPFVNDIRVVMFANEVQKYPLPDKTSIIETIYGCGNASGSGNHTEMWTALLIKTELSPEEIYLFYKLNGDDYTFLDYHVVFKVDAQHKDTFIMKQMNKKFKCLESIENTDGYYIAERLQGLDSYSSYFDLRGH